MSLNRILVLIWLIISQIGVGILILVPLIEAGFFAILSISSGTIQPLAWYIIFVCGVIFTLISLIIASWISFFSNEDETATILSGLCLIIEVGIYTVMQEYNTF